VKKLAFVSLLAIWLAVPALADEKHHKSQPTASAASASAANEGEVRKVDKDAKKITIRHGPLEKLEMPAMTMVFQVKDPAMLDQVKAGDKIRFDAENAGGTFTITRIERAE
jgi:Cu/Ag efflux protein CusF